MSTIQIEPEIRTQKRAGGAFKWASVMAAVLIIAVSAGFLYLRKGGGNRNDSNRSYMHTVGLENLEIRLEQKGELAAVNNTDIICEVEGQTTIQQIVAEGTRAKKGDVLVVLDSSSIKQRIEDTSLDLQRAQADATTAGEMVEIQRSQNSANLEAAQVALALAKLDLQQYEEGTYPQQLKNAQTDQQMAEINVKNKEEDLDQTRSLFAKGFVTAADVKKGELDLTDARNNREKSRTALAVLEKYTHEMDLATKKNALAQAEQKLARTQKENASALSQKTADLSAKTEQLTLLKRRMDRFKEQLEDCTIKAPSEGLVVYASSGDRNSDKPIQEGATVRERQVILRLPDTSSMKAIIRVQESQVGKLREGMRATVRISNINKLIGATLSKISVLADSGNRWWDPDRKEYPVEVTLDETPPALKPGMNAITTIQLSRMENVVAVPGNCIYSVGNDAYVFAPQGEETKPLKVEIGQSSETLVHVKSGLEVGTRIIVLQHMQARDFLEKAGIKADAPATNPDADKALRGSKGKGGKRPPN